MADTTYQAGATSKIVTVKAIVISTGLPYTAGVFNTATISATYTRDGATPTTITLVTATAGTYTSSGFVHRGKGVYEIGAPTAALASGADGVEFAVDGIADVLFRGCRVELTGSDPRAAVVTTTAIADEVQTRTIAAVTTVNGLAANTVTATAIASNAITDAKIATGAITASKFAAGAIDAASIASNAITDAKIASNAITAAKIATDAITDAKIASNAITAAKIADSAITAAKIATDAITDAKIASNAITAAKIATDAITDAKIAASAVTKVADGVVDAEIAVLPTFNRTGANGNTGLQIGTTAFDITTNANAEPIVQIDTPPGP